MNRRKFISKSAMAAWFVLPLVGFINHKPSLRRVNILRPPANPYLCHCHHTTLLKNRPFRDVRKGDIIEVVSAPEDAAHGLKYKAATSAKVQEFNGEWGFLVERV